MPSPVQSALASTIDRKVNVGTYDTEDDAARVFDFAALSLRGVGKPGGINFDKGAYLGSNGSLLPVEAALPGLGRDEHKFVRAALAAAVQGAGGAVEEGGCTAMRSNQLLECMEPPGSFCGAGAGDGGPQSQGLAHKRSAAETVIVSAADNVPPAKKGRVHPAVGAEEAGGHSQAQGAPQGKTACPLLPPRTPVPRAPAQEQVQQAQQVQHAQQVLGQIASDTSLSGAERMEVIDKYMAAMRELSGARP
ncbi:hypothetical protein FOA52_015187 [Chlamydomonas sp. UWO 241]|nr:hypothetical protein FOA52_015187 [Chlamydomonas sp. UWO 241]